jgi:hypothetical protein
MISINWHPTDREVRQFAGIWFPVFCLIVSLLLGLRFGAWQGAGMVIAFAVVIGVVGLVQPRVVRPLYVAWMCAAFPIGWTVSHLLLAAVFYLVIAPLGLVFRASGRDKLKLRPESEVKTFWTRRRPSAGVDQYFRQF